VETFIINVQNKAIAKDLENYIFKFGNSVKLIRLPNPNFSEKKTKSSEGDFFDMAGLWEGTDITTQTIREKAWREI
jgi:hypothetical protein